MSDHPFTAPHPNSPALHARLGIFAKTFVRPSLDQTLAAVADHALGLVQFNLSCAGLPTLPLELSPEQADTIAAALARHRLHIAAISGTFNMAHPDRQARQQGLARLEILCARCDRLGTNVITLCTGSRDLENMWRHHPENVSATAWRDMLETLRRAAELGEQYQVTMAFEPEVANVVHNAVSARRVLDEVGSPRLKVVLDAANLFPAGSLPRMREIIDEACTLLGPDFALVHCKDLMRDGQAGDVAAGKGVLDYNHLLSSLRRVAYDGPLILHGLAENQVSDSVAFLRAVLLTP